MDKQRYDISNSVYWGDKYFIFITAYGWKNKDMIFLTLYVGGGNILYVLQCMGKKTETVYIGWKNKEMIFLTVFVGWTKEI